MILERLSLLETVNTRRCGPVSPAYGVDATGNHVPGMKPEAFLNPHAIVMLKATVRVHESRIYVQ